VGEVEGYGKKVKSDYGRQARVFIGESRNDTDKGSFWYLLFYFS
jgi:hypothetical protein